MTKAMRWGVSSLMIVGSVALGAFAGCSDDEENPPVTETDSGTPDTGSPDTGSKDTGTTPTDTGTPDAPEFVADRRVSLLFAAPDMGPKFVCLGAFAPTGDPTTADAPAQALPGTGALGIPDPADTTGMDTTKTTGFPYGAVVPVPLTAEAIAALKVFKVAIYLLDENPAKMSPASTCSAQWKNVRSDPKKYKIFDPKAIDTGEHGLISMTGCLNAPTDTTFACPTTANFSIKLDKLDTKKPTTAGTMGVQFYNLSNFNPPTAAAIPGFQNVDVYLATTASASSGGDAGSDAASDAASDSATDAPAADAAPAGPTMVKIATGVSYGNLAATASGITLPSGATGANSYLVVLPTGASPCMSAGQPSLTCPAWTLPLAPFFAAYSKAPIYGGFYPGFNELVALVGSPIPKDLDAGAATAPLRIMWLGTKQP
jgi:hypothetical protein